MISLTNEADWMLCEVYAEYIARRKRGIAKRQAVNFLKIDDLQDLLPTWSSDDILSVISELSRAGLVKAFLRSGFILGDKAIIYMENRFKNNLSSVLDNITKLKSILL